MAGEKNINEMIQAYAATLMKDGFLPAVIADKFLSLGAGLFQTLNGTAATAGRLEAAAKALRDEAASDELGESPESGESISRIAELKFRYDAR